MAWRSGGSLFRSVISAARAPPIRSSQPLSRLRPPSSAAPRLPQSRRLSLASSRNLGELGCFQSFLPLHCTSAATAHITSRFNSNLRAFCELSHGMEKMGESRLDQSARGVGLMPHLYLKGHGYVQQYVDESSDWDPMGRQTLRLGTFNNTVLCYFQD